MFLERMFCNSLDQESALNTWSSYLVDQKNYYWSSTKRQMLNNTKRAYPPAIRWVPPDIPRQCFSSQQWISQFCFTPLLQSDSSLRHCFLGTHPLEYSLYPFFNVAVFSMQASVPSEHSTNRCFFFPQLFQDPVTLHFSQLSWTSLT